MSEKIEKMKVDISITTTLKVVGVLLGVFFAYLIRDVIIIFIVALILATLINPLADWFAKRRIPRALAVLLIYVILIGLLASILTTLVPILVEQSGQLGKNLSVYWDSFKDKFPGLDFDVFVDSSSTNSFKPLQAGLPALSGVFSTITGFFGGIITFLLILVLTFYMVVEDSALKKFLKEIAPLKYRPHLVGLMTRAQHKIGMWLRGALTLGLIIGLAVYIGLTILGVKYALVLALLAAVLELIPYIGPPTAAIPAIFLAFSQAPIKGFFTLILYIVIQQLENNLLVPKVMQKAVGLNPIISIISMGIGFKVAGMLGALLAIPIATASSVFVLDFIELKRKKEAN